LHKLNAEKVPQMPPSKEEVKSTQQTDKEILNVNSFFKIRKFCKNTKWISQKILLVIYSYGKRGICNQLVY